MIRNSQTVALPIPPEGRGNVKTKLYPYLLRQLHQDISCKDKVLSIFVETVAPGHLM